MVGLIAVKNNTGVVAICDAIQLSGGDVALPTHIVLDHHRPAHVQLNKLCIYRLVYTPHLKLPPCDEYLHRSRAT